MSFSWQFAVDFRHPGKRTGLLAALSAIAFLEKSRATDGEAASAEY